ncbi:MAG: bifunctional 4-hydroxy-2-oxoglutarate aldolase/2-dehydro-3-deoxy-phosphogluconate aldolase [Brevinematia bacterium]
MDKGRKIEVILKHKALFIIRTDDLENSLKCFEVLVEGGARIIEFTSTIPDFEKAIKKAKKMINNEGILVGAGTILDKELALKALEGDPDFLVNPTQNFEIIDVIPSNKVIFMGGFTPTEIIQNYRKGVDFIKIFPASVLGPKFINSLKKGPLPFIKVLASGGMDISIIREYILSGADVIGIGSEVIKANLIQENNFSKIKELTKQYIHVINETNLDTNQN